MEEHRPPSGPDQPGNRDSAAVRAELVAALAAAHSIQRAAPVELRAALAQRQQRTATSAEGKDAGLLIEAKLLYSGAPGRAHRERERIRRDVDTQVACLHFLRFGECTDTHTQRRGTPD